MSRRTKDLAERLEMFNKGVVEFVENCTEEDWRKVCGWEEWTVGVVARHIGAGHYDIVGLAKMIVNGEKLPELTRGQINLMANQHARDHADCTRAEVGEILRGSGKTLIDFVHGLDDAQLDRTGYLGAIGGEISTEQLIERVILQSGGEHFAHMKAAATA